MNIFINKLLKEANRINNTERTSEYTKMQAVILTPNESIKSLGVLHFKESSNFISEKTDQFFITLRLLPVDYVKKILPYKDDLEMQVVISNSKDRVVRTFVAIPLADGNPAMEGTRTETANLEGISSVKFQEYGFQLMNKGFAKLRNIEAPKSLLMASPLDAISAIMDFYSNSAELTGIDKYEGTSIEYPVHNTKRYKSITVPEGVLLKDVPSYLQESDKYGVYSKGISTFYRNNKWWIVPPFDTDRYKSHPFTAEIIRLPQNKIPTLSNSFEITNQGITILATGEANHIDGTDIVKQTEGLGRRLIMTDAVAGKSGVYYNDGRAITTRADSLAEYQTSTRSSGNEYIPLNNQPTSNPYKYASYNAMSEGTILVLEWQNSDSGYILPCMPVRYSYIGENGSMVTMIGNIIAVDTDHIVFDPMTLNMKRNTRITLFLKTVKE